MRNSVGNMLFWLVIRNVRSSMSWPWDLLDPLR
jgi:hypothetical protein